MAQFKSQHFVPKAYLRNFSGAHHRKTISLYNIERDLVVHDAPIKSQCAVDFLYGKDELEHHLSDIEGKFSEWVTRGILVEPPILQKDIDLFLRFFISIQYMRTAHQIAKMRATMHLASELADLSKDDDLDFLTGESDTDVARENVLRALDMKAVIADLGMVLVRNRTSIEFVTSDHPVVSTNRLYVQRLKRSNFGMGSAGAVLFLPLSPAIAVIFYDTDVYSVDKNGRNWFDLHRAEDAQILNDISFVNARLNVYASNPQVFRNFDFGPLRKLRITEFQSGRFLRKFAEDETGSFYAESDERPEQEGYIIGISQRNPEFSSWPRFLKFRRNAQAIDTRSGAYLVRSATQKIFGGDRNRIKV